MEQIFNLPEINTNMDVPKLWKACFQLIDFKCNIILTRKKRKDIAYEVEQTKRSFPKKNVQLDLAFHLPKRWPPTLSILE